MKSLKYLYCLFALLCLSLCATSCSDDDDSGYSSSELQAILESGDGVWYFYVGGKSEFDKGNSYYISMWFRDGRTNGYTDSWGVTNYQIKNNTILDVNDEYLEGGIVVKSVKKVSYKRDGGQTITYYGMDCYRKDDNRDKYYAVHYINE